MNRKIFRKAALAAALAAGVFGATAWPRRICALRDALAARGGSVGALALAAPAKR
mgnify:CR=1 FL=1